MSDGVDNFENAEERGGIANFICSKDVLAVLPTEFRKSLLVQLIPGLCVELYIDDDVPDELEQHFKDIRAHCYCASLVRMLYMTWRVPRHVFQACAPSRNSTKYRADDLCGN